jgi:putative acetyltransferase
MMHLMEKFSPPEAMDGDLVGTYPARAFAGGGYVWDEVLEYRVWCHPESGTGDLADGSDYYYAFATYEEARVFSEGNSGVEQPLALILQREYIEEPEPGEYRHEVQERRAEWPVDFLSRRRRRANTIPDFLASGPPPNLDLLRSR